MAKKRRKKRPYKPRETAVAPTPKAQPVADRKRAAAADERPPAPWGNFPLVEIGILVGIILLIAGLFVGDRTGALMIGIGIGLAALGGLELSIREHFAGFRSHSSLLAGIPAIATLALLFYAGPESLPPVARLGIAAVVFAGAFYGFTAMFRRKAGVAFKLR